MVRRLLASQPTAWQRWRDLRPVLAPEVVVDSSEGIVTLCAPLARRKGFLGVLGKSVDPVRMKRYELEPVGQFVIEQIDGKRSVLAIARSVQTHCKMSRIESETATAAFFDLLAERGLLSRPERSR